MHLKLGVIGNPVAHSLSPEIHAHFANQFGISIKYSKILVPIHKLKEFVYNFKNEGGIGLNITSPFKREAFLLCTHKSERALLTKSVNTLHFRDNDIFGDNTDGIGFINDVQRNLRYSLHDKNILLAGAGGAARGVLPFLIAQKPQKIFIMNRNQDKAKELIQDFSCYQNIFLCRNNDLSVNVVIDCTSEENNFFEHINLSLAKNSLCYDLKYGRTTSFLQWAKENGGSIISDGFGMLVEQAAEAFFIWTGKKPETKVVIESLT